jgi:hypothetical protein
MRDRRRLEQVQEPLHDRMEIRIGCMLWGRCEGRLLVNSRVESSDLGKKICAVTKPMLECDEHAISHCMLVKRQM